VDVAATDVDRDVEVRLLDVAVDVEPVLVAAVRKRLDPGSHQLLGAVEDLVGERREVEVVVVEKRRDALGADLRRAGHRAEVAEQQVRHAAVRAHDRERELVLLTGLVQLERWHAEALGEDVVALDLRRVAADVGHVGDGPEKGDHLVAPEDGAEEDVVRQMARSDPGVVRRQDIAVPERLDRKPLEQHLGRSRIDLRERRRAPARLTEGASVGVGEDAREVASFAQDRREGRPDDDLVDLVHDGDQALPEQVERDRVECGRAAAQRNLLSDRAPRLSRLRAYRQLLTAASENRYSYAGDGRNHPRDHVEPADRHHERDRRRDRPHVLLDDRR
jgi:hypothetical protein